MVIFTSKKEEPLYIVCPSRNRMYSYTLNLDVDK